MSTPLLLVSVHDVAPPTASAARRWAHLLAPTGIPMTFLAVPGPWRGARFGDRGDDGLDLAGWLRTRQQGGDEICVHGWCHRADLPGAPVRRWLGSTLARGAAEFWALDRATAAARTADGLEVLDRHGLAVIGTTPPGWLASRPAQDGLRDAGLHYTTDHAGVVALASRRRWVAPALCHRPASSSGVRPLRISLPARAAESVGRAMVGSAWRVVQAGGSVRIAVHPDDLDRPGLAQATVSTVRRCLEAGAIATTYGQISGWLRDRG